MAHWTERTFVDDADCFLRELRARVDERRHETRDLLDRLARRDHGVDRALDLACGPGVHAVDLARSGLHVDAIDISERYVALARERAADAGVTDRSEFRVHDMRDLDDLDATYDLVTNRYSSFGYYDDATNEAILEDCHDRLRTGGLLAFELTNREGLLSDFETESVREYDDGLGQVKERIYDPETARVETTHRELDRNTGEQMSSFTTDERLYAPVEIRRLLEGAGFGVELFASFDGRELDRTSERIVAIGTKG